MREQHPPAQCRQHLGKRFRQRHPTGHHVIGQLMHGRALPHVDGCRDEDRAGPGKFGSDHARRASKLTATTWSSPGCSPVVPTSRAQQFEVVHVGCRVGNGTERYAASGPLTAYLSRPLAGLLGVRRNHAIRSALP